MAEAFTNFFAKERGLDVTAQSAGTVGGKDLNPLAKSAMEEVGIPMAGQFPKLISQEMVRNATKVISMGCGVDAAACPAKFILTEDWDLDDPAGKSIDEVRRIRDQIRDKVTHLLDLEGLQSARP